MRYLLILCLLSVGTYLFAQTPDTFFMDRYQVPCDSGEATFYRIEQISGSLKLIREYAYPSDQLLCEGADISTIYGPLKDGLWTWFYANGARKKQCLYFGGNIQGKSTEWHPNGQKKAEWKYQEKAKELAASWDEDGREMVVHGTGLFEDYYDNGQLHQQGRVKLGKQEGEWKAWHRNGRLMHRLTFREGIVVGKEEIWDSTFHRLYTQEHAKAGKRADVKYQDSKGKILYHAKWEVKKEKTSWVDLGNIEPYRVNFEYIKEAIGFMDEMVRAGAQGEVRIKMLINMKGRVEKVDFLVLADPLLRKNMLNIVKELRYTPPIVDGALSKVWLDLPVKFIILDD